MTFYDFCRNYMHRPLRTSPIEVITIHSLQGGKSTVEAVDEWYQKRIKQGYSSCSNYAIAYDGKVGIYVPEDRRAATSSSTKNDNRALTIEVATDKDKPLYTMYDKSQSSLISLLIHLCIEHGKNGVELLSFETKYEKPKDGYFGITLHRWFADTDCPGNDIMNKLSAIVQTVNAKLKPIYRVQVGAYLVESNAEAKLKKIKVAGFDDAYIVSSVG